MDWDRHEALSRRWTSQTHRYCAAINEYVARGTKDGWDAAGEQPKDDRGDELGSAVVEVVRQANTDGAWRGLRERFPTAHAPFIASLDEKAVAMRSVRWIDDSRVVATVGTPWSPEAVLVFGIDGESEVVADALDVGSSPDRAFFALLGETDIRVIRGWGGEVSARLPRPRGDEGVVEGVETLEDDEDLTAVLAMHVLPDGTGVVLATSCGVFVTRADGVARLSPDREELSRRVADWDDDEPYPLRCDMTHAAVSPDGSLIACGYQDSQHELRGPDGALYARFGPIHSEYPHHAAFSPDGRSVIVNSCHFYNGATFIGQVEALEGARIDSYEEDVRLLPLEHGCRVYDSAHHDGAFLLGDAHGYVRAAQPSGDTTWRHFVGSTIGGVDVSPDGRHLAIATYAGFLSLLDVDGDPDPAQIGDSPFRERIRYVRWAGEVLWRW